MKLSIVTTLYHSAPYVEEFYRRVCSEAERLTSEYDIVFVNDGSPDESLDIVRSLAEKDARVTVVDLSRNYGHHKAMMTGLAHTRGDLVLMMDCDLEEAPELLGLFHAEMRESGADVVYGVVERRQGKLFERLSGRLFYWFYNLLADHRVPANATLSRLMSRRYVDALVEHRESEVFLLGLCVLAGFSQLGVPVTKKRKGTTTYSLARRISLFVNAVTSFSGRPLVLIFYVGGAISALSILAALYLTVKKLFFEDYLVGWSSVVVSVWLMGGLTLFCLGLIGIYLSKVLMETKKRPYTVVREVYGQRAGREAPREPRSRAGVG